MGLTVTDYPVYTDAGIVINAFPGFLPIDVGFESDDPTITGVEVVLIDPDTEVDILGFSLFADINPDDTATVDVSIINDKNSQDVILDFIEIEDSRIEFKVKYRPVYEDGTEDAYIIIEDTPIIAVFSIADFDLDKWVTVLDEPKFWKGYPVMSGLIHSTENEIGLSIIVRYDTLDIQKNILTADNILDGFGASDFGVLATDLYIPDEGVQEVYPVTNGGADGTGDWTNPTDGLAENWFTDKAVTASIIIGSGFTTNAQSIIAIDAINTSFSGIAVNGLNPAKTYKLRFKYRCSGFVSYWIRGSIVTAPLTNNILDAILVEKSITLTAGGYIAGFDLTGTGSWIEVDELEVISEESGGITEDTEYIDYKIISE